MKNYPNLNIPLVEASSPSFPQSLMIAMPPLPWPKNLIIFAAVLFAFRPEPEAWIISTVTFCLFCCLSSSIYLFNDVAHVKPTVYLQSMCSLIQLCIFLGIVS